MISERSKRAGIKELKIFDNFKIDNELPKYSGRAVEQKDGRLIFTTATNVATMGTDTSSTGNQVFLSVPSEGSNEDWGEVPENSFTITNPGRLHILKRLGVAFTLKSRIKKLEKQKKAEKLITIRDYFLNLAEGFSELTPLADIADHYEKAILQAEKLGQRSLVEKFKDMLEVVRGEAHLIQMGVKFYVTNEQVCDFHESVDEDKNLKLTWIEHFVKVIPNEIVELKSEIDKRGVFDNYVILHYDPNGNATSLTKEEIEVKKDPILFGVIKNSKRLYYIGDWKDDYCNLTLEDMFEKLGEKTLEINNKNLKTYITKVGDYKQRRRKLKSHG